MSPASGLQPAHWWHLWAVLASQAPGCTPWHPEMGHGSSTLQWHWGHAGWSRTRVVPGMLSGSRAVGHRCPWGTSTVPLRQRGPQIPPAQPSSFSQRREPYRAAWEPLSSRLSPGGVLQLGRGAPCPAGPALRGQASKGRRLLRQLACGLPCPSLGLQPCGCQGRLKRLKMPKPASLELTPLPGQVPPPPGLGCRRPGSTSPKPTVLGDALGWCGSRGRAWRARARVPHAPDLRSSIASYTHGGRG